MSARHGAGGGFFSDVSFAIRTSLPNFSSLRSGSQVDAPWMRGSRRGAGRAPAEPEPKRLPGWTRASQVQVGCQARRRGRRRAAGGVWLRAPAPLRVLAGQRRGRPGLGVGSPAWRRLRAASLPAALPARRQRRRRRRPRQTMNLRARGAEAGLGPATLGPVSPRQPRPPAEGVPSPPVLAVLWAPRALGTPREGSHAPLPGSGKCGRSSGTGDSAAGWWRRGQPEAGGGRTPRGTHGVAVQENDPRSRNRGGALQAEDRRTDRSVLSP